MTYLKKYGLRLLYTIISILLSLLLITLIYNYNFINQNTYKILKIIVFLLSIFINSFLLGKKSLNKGYLEGIKFSLIIIILLIFLTLIFKLKFKFSLILYYLIILSTSTLGSMIGISRNNPNKKRL